VTTPVLRLDAVVVRVNAGSLLDVDHLAVGPGETLALIGPNGAGKTTLLHVAALLRKPDVGTVTILGQTATTHNAATLRRALSVVFQAPLLFDTRVLANAAAGLRFHGRPRIEAETRARTWLERFGVAHLTNRRARTLSSGEAARVALARAFATEPAMLLLDEPFSALDGPTRISVLPALRQRLHETGTAAVLVTHDREEAFAFADRIAVMEAGRIVACGDAPSLIACPPSHQVALLLGIETILPAQVVCINGEHAVVALTTRGPSLRTRTPLRATVAAGEMVTVTLPAGAVYVCGPDDVCPPEWNVLPGRVGAVTSLPSGTRLVVETPAPIVAFAPWQPEDRRWLVGDPAIVAFSPESAHVIPERAQLPIPYPSERSELNSSYGRARDGRHHGH
jgi:tungstate transport system ATP-binding protein